jgi:hypothetical protein
MSATLDLFRNLLQAFKDNSNKLPCDTELTANIDPAGLATETSAAATATALGSLDDAADKTGGATSVLAKLRGAVQLLVDLIAVAGTTSGAAVITDANGTIQQYLRGLVVKLLLVGLESTQLLVRKAVAPSLGTVVYVSVSGTSADSGTIATAGTYELTANVACWVRVNAATAGDAAVAATAPTVLLPAGDRLQVAVGANGAIVAITTGGTGVLGYQLVS